MSKFLTWLILCSPGIMYEIRIHVTAYDLDSPHIHINQYVFKIYLHLDWCKSKVNLLVIFTSSANIKYSVKMQLGFVVFFFGLSFILWSQDSNLFILPLCYYHKVIVDISLVSQFKHPFFVLLVTALWSSLGKISPPLLVHVQGGGMTQDWPIWALGSSGYGEWFRDEYTIPSEPTGRNPFFFQTLER